jgi:hypothetical protein
MKNKFRIPAMIMTIVAASTMCTAAFGGGWSGRQVTDRLTHRNNRIVEVLGLYGSWANPDSCDRDTMLVLHPDQMVDASSYSETLTLLLGAHLTGREVNLYLSGCAAIGNKTYPVITRVAVH